MKIEAGKFYRCRDGSKARVYAVYANKVHGAVFIRGDWITKEWAADGLAYASYQAEMSDLISEWSEIEPTEAQVEAALHALGDDIRVMAFESTARAIARAVLNAPKGE